jgi:PBP1b-binding outer membrane lipoprotein LpoB
MKKLLSVLFVAVLLISCKEARTENQTAVQEQAHTEGNQARLNQNQPLPDITWSMERDNLIKLKNFKTIEL